MDLGIDRKLNLVMRVWRGEGVLGPHVHSTALPTEIIEQYGDLCGPTMNALLVEGYGYTAPRWASSVFKQVALRKLGPEPQEDKEPYQRMKAAVEARVKAFYNEIHRLTLVFVLKDSRWQTLPIEEAVAIGAITAGELSRIDAALVFFTCGWESVSPSSREAILGGLAYFDARPESSSSMEFANFLQTSMRDASTGESPDASPPSLTSQPERDSASSSPTPMRPNSPTARPAPIGFGITQISR